MVNSFLTASDNHRNTQGRNEFLRAGVRPATPLICEFIDEHKDTYGVAPICRALAVHGVQIAPRTYWAHRLAAPSKRALWDTTITEILAGYYEPDADGKRPPECLYGSLKMWAHLQRQGIPVARRTVERIMRAQRLARGDPGSPRAAHHRARSGRSPGTGPGGPAVAGCCAEPAGGGRLHLFGSALSYVQFGGIVACRHGDWQSCGCT